MPTRTFRMWKRGGVCHAQYQCGSDAVHKAKQCLAPSEPDSMNLRSGDPAPEWSIRAHRRYCSHDFRMNLDRAMIDKFKRTFGRLLKAMPFILPIISTFAMAIEEPKYTVVKKDDDIEIRLYGPYIMAETVVDTSDFDEASNEGFRRLAGYIFGGNSVRQKISMTAPVSTEESRKIAMTAPVQTEQQGTSLRMTFMMPSEFVLDSLPVPNDPRVTLHQVPARKFAAITFSGRWTEENFNEHAEELKKWIEKEGLKVAGAPVIARYNPPFIPFFFRRNEVLIPVE
jgi:hypothetical protein